MMSTHQFVLVHLHHAWAMWLGRCVGLSRNRSKMTYRTRRVLSLKFVRQESVILSEVWRAFCAKRSRKPALSEGSKATVVERGPAVRAFDFYNELQIHRN